MMCFLLNRHGSFALRHGAHMLSNTGSLPFNGADVESILGAAIAGALALELAMRLPSDALSRSAGDHVEPIYSWPYRRFPDRAHIA
jgi:hypothetical protein